MCTTSVKGSGLEKNLYLILSLPLGILSHQAHAEPGAGRNTDRAIGNFEPFDKVAVKLCELSNLRWNDDPGRGADKMSLRGLDQSARAGSAHMVSEPNLLTRFDHRAALANAAELEEFNAHGTGSFPACDFINILGRIDRLVGQNQRFDRGRDSGHTSDVCGTHRLFGHQGPVGPTRSLG